MDDRHTPISDRGRLGTDVPRAGGSRGGRGRRRLVEGNGEEVLVLPRAAVTMFALILAQVAQGRGVSVIPSHAELSTQQAADMLNVSRPYLISLLESGKIRYRKVGRHRRTTLDDLLGYLRQDDLERRAAADELAEVSQELGLY